jgi:hypothetical protein
MRVAFVFKPFQDRSAMKYSVLMETKAKNDPYPAIVAGIPQFRRLLLCVLLFSSSVFSEELSNNEEPGNIDEMTEQSDFVFEGTVTRVDYRFVTPTTEDGPNQPFPYTYVTYQVNNIYKGNSRSSTVTLRFAGGPSENVGDYMLLAGQPMFDANDHDILYVSGNDMSPCPLVDCAKGRMRMIDNMVVNDEGRPVTVNPDGTLTLGAPLDLEDVNTHNMNDVITLHRQEVDEHGNPVVLLDPNSISRDGLLDPDGFGMLLQERVQALYSEEELATLPEFVSANPDRHADEDIATYFGVTATQDSGGETGPADAGITIADIEQQQREQLSHSNWKKLAVADTGIVASQHDVQDAGFKTDKTGSRSNLMILLILLIPVIYFLVRRYR